MKPIATFVILVSLCNGLQAQRFENGLQRKRETFEKDENFLY